MRGSPSTGAFNPPASQDACKPLQPASRSGGRPGQQRQGRLAATSSAGAAPRAVAASPWRSCKVRAAGGLNDSLRLRCTVIPSSSASSRELPCNVCGLPVLLVRLAL